jgi:hypothetical protein
MNSPRRQLERASGEVFCCHCGAPRSHVAIVRATRHGRPEQRHLPLCLLHAMAFAARWGIELPAAEARQEW